MSQHHIITLPVSLVPTLPLPISCSAELFVWTNLPPTTHCAKLMFHPQHIDQGSIQGICILLTPERWYSNHQHLSCLQKTKYSSLTDWNYLQEHIWKGKKHPSIVHCSCLLEKEIYNLNNKRVEDDLACYTTRLYIFCVGRSFDTASRWRCKVPWKGFACFFFFLHTWHLIGLNAQRKNNIRHKT